ncbi:hypothetical protein L218DRAFT_947412 [Marasmius fiardii PR-910]|nr:hypothetical protein L218DRAFT_947412 [Marasmius fiardii PR-910]
MNNTFDVFRPSGATVDLINPHDLCQKLPSSGLHRQGMILPYKGRFFVQSGWVSEGALWPVGIGVAFRHVTGPAASRDHVPLCQHCDSRLTVAELNFCNHYLTSKNSSDRSPAFAALTTRRIKCDRAIVTPSVALNLRDSSTKVLTQAQPLSTSSGLCPTTCICSVEKIKTPSFLTSAILNITSRSMELHTFIIPAKKAEMSDSLNVRLKNLPSPLIRASKTRVGDKTVLV